ncbi:hypothetical protein CC2G_011411 [Coprinopsis cinerea AmutBmut pab1-1]|nr:hypothetical protein CC2G_011411 [Coprinopsis cinerea AmutBmut pab1-1]
MSLFESEPIPTISLSEDLAQKHYPIYFTQEDLLELSDCDSASTCSSRGTTLVSDLDSVSPFDATATFDIFSEEEEWGCDEEFSSTHDYTHNEGYSNLFTAVMKHKGYLEQLLEHTASAWYPCRCEFCQLEDGILDLF